MLSFSHAILKTPEVTVSNVRFGGSAVRGFPSHFGTQNVQPRNQKAAISHL
jgi:hypothetical protein